MTTPTLNVSGTFPDPTVEPMLKLERAAELLGLSRNLAYVSAAQGALGSIPVHRFGSTYRVATVDVLRVLGRL